jgi:hypothetical protein
MSEISTPDAAERRRRRERQREQREARAERRESLFDLIRAGYSYDQVARRIGVSVKTLRREIARALDARERAPRRYVNLQLARLDKAMQVVDVELDEANLAAIPALLQLQAQYDRYEGLAARLSSPAALAEAGQVLAPKPLKSLVRGAKNEPTA